MIRHVDIAKMTTNQRKTWTKSSNAGTSHYEPDSHNSPGRERLSERGTNYSDNFASVRQ